MKKLALICILLAFVFAFNVHAFEKDASPPTDISKPTISDGDLFPTYPSIVNQIYEARKNENLAAYQELLEEYTMTFPGQPQGTPQVFVEEGDLSNAPLMRWGPDIVLYSGDVFYNSWAMTGGIDDEAISVDCHVGDTLIAAVSCPDSFVRVFRSYDSGMTWNHMWNLSASNEQLVEPEVIYGPHGHYHIFNRCTWNNGSILVFNFDEQGNWTSQWAATTSDTIHAYTVCSDRSDFYSDYFLYLMYHRGIGGENLDEIDFTRSLDQGENWEAPDTLQIMGSGWPDLSWGNSGYLYLTRTFWYSNEKRVYTRRSSTSGNSWFGSELVYSDGDSVNTLGPQIAASHDGTGDSWVLISRQNPYTTYGDYGLYWTWSQDHGATWSSCAYVGSIQDYNEVLPSISVHDGYLDSLYAPYVTFIRSYYDWTDPVVYCFNWQTDSTWTTIESYNDSVPALTRPIQTWQSPGVPAMAYVGEGGTNVYFDSWSNAVEEEKEPPVSNQLTIKTHPNPFSKTTRVQYSLPTKGIVSVHAYNILGQRVATLFDGVQESGNHYLQWNGVGNNGTKLPRGVYFLRIKTQNSKKMTKLTIIN